jgi:hypothetical protein
LGSFAIVGETAFARFVELALTGEEGSGGGGRYITATGAEDEGCCSIPKSVCRTCVIACFSGKGLFKFCASGNGRN